MAVYQGIRYRGLAVLVRYSSIVRREAARAMGARQHKKPEVDEWKRNL
jgi:hypothetical protein